MSESQGAPATTSSESENNAAVNQAVVCLQKDPARTKYILVFFYLTFAFLAAIGAVVLLFVLFPSSRQETPKEFEVLTLPGANTDCNTKPDPDSLQFCVILQGCADTPLTPGGRCGLGSGSVFYTGMAFICVNPSNKKRIIGSSGIFNRNMTTYSLTCAGAQAGTSLCLTPALPKSALSCEMFWPTLRAVITRNTSSTGFILDPSGSFQIQGAVDSDPNIWFNMCGFCSYARFVEMYAFLSTCVCERFVFKMPIT